MNLYRIYLLFLLLFSFSPLMSCREEDPPVVEESAVSYLALGDSYTIGESVGPSERFPVLLANALQEEGIPVAEPDVVAQTGWTTTDLLQAIARSDVEEKNYELVSLLIGVNNQYQGRSLEEYAEEFRLLLNKAIALAGGEKERVFVLSIPDYGYTPFGEPRQEAISAQIDQFNTVNKEIAMELGVLYFNITPISRQGLAKPELIAEDGLHPSGEMYRQWVKLVLPEVAKRIKKP